MRDARIFAADAQADPGAKTESCEQERHTRKLGNKIVQRGPDIALLAETTVVDAGAESCIAKIEPQHWDTDGIQRFRCLINHFVVHRPAKKRMGVADNCSERRTPGRGRFPQDCFKPSGRSFQKEIASAVGAGHRWIMGKFAV